jgi:hypothetical protein
MYGNNTKETPCVASLISKLAKASCFSFIFFLLKNWRTGWQNRSHQGGRVCASGSGEMVGKGDRKMNAVHIMCPRVCKCKDDTC